MPQTARHRCQHAVSHWSIAVAERLIGRSSVRQPSIGWGIGSQYFGTTISNQRSGSEKAFADIGGVIFAWRDERALEDDLFHSLSVTAVGKMIDFAIEIRGDDLIDQHIKSATNNASTLATVRYELHAGALSAEARVALGKAARAKKAGWFKSVSWMEHVGREIAAPDLPNAEEGFRDIVHQVLTWTRNG